MKKIKIIAIITALAAAFANTAAYANETWQDWPHVGTYSGNPIGGMVENYNYFYPPKENGQFMSVEYGKDRYDYWELPIDYTKYDEYSICFDKELQAVTDYYGDGGDVEIPSEIDGVPVKSIYGGGKFDIVYRYSSSWEIELICLTEFGAFKDNKDILRVTLPDTVTSIESCAFYNASNLESINIPEGVTNIGAMAFYGTALKAIELPSTLKIIGPGAFTGTDIENVRIPGSVKKNCRRTIIRT